MLDLQRLRDRIRATIPYRAVPLWRGQAIALCCVLAASLLRWPLDPVLAGQLPFVTFFPAVLLASIWGGSRAGISAVAFTLVIAGIGWGGPAVGVRFEVLPTASLIAFVVFGGVVVFLTDLLRSTLKDLALSERQAQVLAREMRHRVKNALAMATAISSLTARSATSVHEYKMLLEGRLNALARAPEYGPGIDLDPPTLSLLVGHVLEPFGLDRFECSGPALRTPLRVGRTVALLLHELATNAAKYGALSVPAGKVSLTWGSEPGAIVIDWIERGGPAVGRPSRLGFGSRLLASALPKDRATVTLDYHVEGVRCRITLIVLPEFVAEDVARQMKTEPVAAEDQPAGEAKLTDESGQVRPLEVARLRHRCAELFRRGTISGHRRPTGSSAGGGTSLFGRFVVDNITSQDLNNLRVLACDLNGTTRG